ncbi:MAG TPA: putative Ig domain-containing protein [Chloroflexota bacterium]|jgi:hypothetical protein
MLKIARRAVWLGFLVLVAIGMAALALPANAGSDEDPTPTPRPALTPTPAAIPQSTPTATATPTTPTLVITTSSPLPDGNVGTDYAVFLTSSGGRGTPHQWTLVSGTLPDGLAMASSYGVQSTVISGKPARVQTTSFTVEVADGTGHTATAAFSITINPPRPLVITNQSSTLAPGTVGTSYATSLFADGGVQPYTWTIVAGQLPPGLRLSGNVISGTPTTRGTFTFTARVTDSGGQQASSAFSITVS